MADTKDTDIAPDELDGLAGGVGRGLEAETTHATVADGHGSHLEGGHGGVGGAHTK